MVTGIPSQKAWPLWQKILFRLSCIYFLLHIAPWSWVGYDIPGIAYLIDLYDKSIRWIIEWCNTAWFHFEKTNIVNNGSGDTSAAWKEMYTYLCMAVTGTLLWSIWDRKRPSYTVANYWLQTFLRYFLIINCFAYGFIKLYPVQMTFPSQSALATPLGDFLPMRFSWMFIGYSAPYEMFSGAMETLTGILLLNRKTITLGVLMTVAVFTNVMALNLSYDIPVKLFSIHLTLYSLYLLLNDSKRLLNLFILNKPVAAATQYQLLLPRKWMRIGRVVLKLVFIGLFVVMSFINARSRYRNMQNSVDHSPIKAGIYDVITYAVNKDTIPSLVTDTTRWRDVIFEKGEWGSVGTTDTLFRQRYRRGYFNTSYDTLKKTIDFKKTANAENAILKFRYQLMGDTLIVLSGSRNKDSLYVVLKKSNRHFQLAEKQFHWISEANR